MSARRFALGTVVVLALCGWCGSASGFHQSAPAAFAAWSASLAGVAVIDLLLWRGRRHRRWAIRLRPVDHPWPRPGRGGTSRVLLGTAPWLALALIVVAWEVLGIDTGPHDPHLTVSALSLAFRPFGAGLWLAWIVAGLGYGVARARVPMEEGPGPSAPATMPGGSSGAVAPGPHAGVAPALLLPHSRGVGVAFWVAVVVACLLIDVLARRSHGRWADAGELVRLASGPPLARVALIAGWAYAGWHLFAH